MARRKVSTSEANPNAVDLDANEELVIENTKRIRRETRPAAPEDTEPISAIPVIEDEPESEEPEIEH